MFPLTTESWPVLTLSEPAEAPADAWRELLAGARRGDEKISRQLVDALYPHVIRIVRAHLPARTDEEDVAQEIFMKMFSRLDQYRGPQPLHHWVCRIATNTCFDLLRKQKARPEVRFSDLSDAEQHFLNIASHETTEDAPAMPHESREIVDKLLSTLKPDQQVVVRLLDVERQSVQEICNRTGWSASKVKVTALRARRKLAEVVERLGTRFLP